MLGGGATPCSHSDSRSDRGGGAVRRGGGVRAEATPVGRGDPGDRMAKSGVLASARPVAGGVTGWKADSNGVGIASGAQPKAAGCQANIGNRPARRH